MTYGASKARQTMTLSNENAKVVELRVKWAGRWRDETGKRKKRVGNA